MAPNRGASTANSYAFRAKIQLFPHTPGCLGSDADRWCPRPDSNQDTGG
jgi:hypothetical protein